MAESESPVSGESCPAPGASSDSDQTRVSVWNGIPLHVWKWIPNGTIKALVYISHGVGEHMGRYEKLCQELAENGILAFGHDHVGHGKSGGDRVHLENFHTYVQDVADHVTAMKSSYPGVPCVLMGHSMGGVIATLVAQEHQDLFRGVVLSSTGLEIDPNAAGPVIQFFAKVVAFIVPQYGILPVDPSLISTIPEEVEMYKNDPLVYHMGLKAKWASEFMNNIKIGREKVKEISLPVLVFHGTEDHLVPISASEYIFESIGTAESNKTFERFEGSAHEVLHDKDQSKARDLIRDWILAHTD